MNFFSGSVKCILRGFLFLFILIVNFSGYNLKFCWDIFYSTLCNKFGTKVSVSSKLNQEPWDLSCDWCLTLLSFRIRVFVFQIAWPKLGVTVMLRTST